MQALLAQESIETGDRTAFMKEGLRRWTNIVDIHEQSPMPVMLELRRLCVNLLWFIFVFLDDSDSDVYDKKSLYTGFEVSSL